MNLDVARQQAAGDDAGLAVGLQDAAALCCHGGGVDEAHAGQDGDGVVHGWLLLCPSLVGVGRPLCCCRLPASGGQ